MTLNRLLGTSSRDYASTLLRLAFAVMIFSHGAQKVLGWFGGHGYSATMAMFTGMGIPAFFAFLAIIAEFAGAIGLFFGFLTRTAALGLLVEMVVAVFIAHPPGSPVMGWFSGPGGAGMEVHVLMVGIALALLIRGGGAVSVDAAITDRSRKTSEPKRVLRVA